MKYAKTFKQLFIPEVHKTRISINNINAVEGLTTNMERCLARFKE